MSVTVSKEFQQQLDNAGVKNGLQIWRVKPDNLIPLPKSSYGVFHESHAYIILRTYTSVNGVTKMSLHYWTGKTSSRSIRNKASEFTVKLYAQQSCLTTQYREVQGFESTEFEKYFKRGLIYVRGEVREDEPEGFPHFHVKRIFHVNGEFPTRAAEVDFAWSSFVRNDVFLIDIGNVIMIWRGHDCTDRQLAKGMMLAKMIKTFDREELGYIHTVHDFQNQKDNKMLKELLGKLPDSIPAKEVKEEKKTELSEIVIFTLKKGEGLLVELNEERWPQLNKRSLLNDECYMIDVPGKKKVFLWIGQDCNPHIKSIIWSAILNYLEQLKRPLDTQVQIIDDGGETDEFIALFSDWDADPFPCGRLTDRRYSFKVARFDQPEMPGAGDGRLEVFLIDKKSLVPIDPSMYGKFFSGECYIVRYTFKEFGKEMKIMYYWEGRRSGSSTLLSTPTRGSRLNSNFRLDGTTECRVEIGKEPAHFVAFFKGKFMVLKGSDPKSSNQENPPAPNPDKVPGVTLYVVRGSNIYNTKAIQVRCSSSSLNCNYPYICTTPNTVFLWCGKGCIGDQRDMGHIMANNMLGNKPLWVLEEGNEVDEFFAALGGRKEYSNKIVPKDPDTVREAVTFYYYENNGKYYFKEMYNISRHDLHSEDIVLIDIYDEVYIWLGSKVDSELAQRSFPIAFRYLQRSYNRGDMKTAVLLVKEGSEPNIFTRFIPNWEDEQPKNNVEERLTPAHVKRLLDNEYGLPVYSIQQLSTSCPQGVDPTKKERYLSERDFAQTFRMTREEFSKLSEWYRNDLKKKFNLF
uniref:villin-1-like isoform X2 n=1 Tax=Ciona intestinalis TaxID=7719 RepID=UPI000EF4DFAE|nr:villin-1-like isoform X2 [Ciona intestinalis]|eukprot:XP_026691596.1 villin-1-like isoform X2 [Ciona intestinalis]